MPRPARTKTLNKAIACDRRQHMALRASPVLFRPPGAAKADNRIMRIISFDPRATGYCDIADMAPGGQPVPTWRCSTQFAYSDVGRLA